MLLVGAFALSLSNAAFAGSATWKANPSTNDWNTAANWSPATIPNAPEDMAKFGSSSITDVSISSEAPVGGIIFNRGASAFTLTVGSPTGFVDFGVHGDITNNSGKTQNLITATSTNGSGGIFFFGGATVGDMIVITNEKEIVVGSGGGLHKIRRHI
jgi:hypothetical protein